MSTSKSGTNSREHSLSGFSQRIVNPNNPASVALSTFAPFVGCVPIQIGFGVASYNHWIPDGCLVVRVTVVVADGSFTAGSTLNMGSAPNGTDLLSGIDLTQPSMSFLANPVLSSALSRNGVQNVRPFYFSIAGSPTAGNGWIFLEYVNL